MKNKEWIIKKLHDIRISSYLLLWCKIACFCRPHHPNADAAAWRCTTSLMGVRYQFLGGAPPVVLAVRHQNIRGAPLEDLLLTLGKSQNKFGFSLA